MSRNLALSSEHIGQHSECRHWRHLMPGCFLVLWKCWTAIWNGYNELTSITANACFSKLNLVSAFQFWFLLCWKSRCYSYLKLVGGGFESTWHTTRDSSPLATPTACPWLKHTGASRIKIFPTWEEKWFVILHWTISETTLLFPEPSLLVAWQEYSPQREMSIQNLFHQSHYFVRNL